MLWYLSFADASRPEGEQWLGACMIRANSEPAALTASHMQGCNPGGEIQMVAVPDGAPEPPERFIGRLLSRADIEEMDRVMANA